MPSESRETSPTRRDTKEHHNDSTRQHLRTGVTDFERHNRQLLDQQQRNNQQSTDTTDTRVAHVNTFIHEQDKDILQNTGQEKNIERIILELDRNPR